MIGWLRGALGRHVRRLLGLALRCSNDSKLTATMQRSARAVEAFEEVVDGGYALAAAAGFCRLVAEYLHARFDLDSQIGVRDSIERFFASLHDAGHGRVPRLVGS